MVEKFFSSFLHCSGGSIRSFVAVTGSYVFLYRLVLPLLIYLLEVFQSKKQLDLRSWYLILNSD